jgi:hypothetical protein
MLGTFSAEPIAGKIEACHSSSVVLPCCHVAEMLSGVQGVTVANCRVKVKSEGKRPGNNMTKGACTTKNKTHY